jgi:hypothetical protein
VEYLFICGLFNDGFDSWDYVASIYTVISTMNWKYVEWNGRDLIYGTAPAFE